MRHYSECFPCIISCYLQCDSTGQAPSCIPISQMEKLWQSVTSLRFVVVQSLRRVWLSVTPWTVAHQAPLSMGSPGKNTGEGCHALLQGIFPTQGSNPGVLHWQVDSLPLSYQWSPPWGCTANNCRNLLTSVGPQPLFWVFWLRDGKWNWPHTDDAGDVPASLMLAALQFVSRSSDGSLCFCVDFTHSSV